MKKEPLARNKILILRKLSVLEYDQAKFGLSEKEAILRYQKMGADTERILKSHDRQQKNFQNLMKFFPGSQIYKGEGLKKDLLKSSLLVIVFGGDNYFQYVSHFINNQLVLGINADPQTSEGALLNYQPKDIPHLFEIIKKGNYEIQEWTRLETILNNRKLKAQALSEVYVGCKERIAMSRYSLEINNSVEEHKDSGIIICTGSGSTGWYKSAASCAHETAPSFSKTNKEARFICSESYLGKMNKAKLFCGIIETNQVLTVSWFAHENGIISLDSKPRSGTNYILKRGSKLEVKISQTPLRVII
jgi:NAD kinase